MTSRVLGDVTICTFNQEKQCAKEDCYLVHILTEMSGYTTMVFTKRCDDTQILSLALRNLGFRAIPINGDMSQARRLESLNKFKVGEYNILVCTDVASRGLDIPSVDMVINYNIPDNPKEYLHRVGRTARAGRSRTAISLVTQYDIGQFKMIETVIHKTLPELDLQREEVLLLLNRVKEATRLAHMEGGGKRRKSYADGAEQEMERIMMSYHNKGKTLKKARLR